MPYRIGAKGSYGCSGYPAVKEGGEVMGCHTTRAEAAAQIYAINRSEGNIGKAMPNLKEGDWALTSHGEEDEFHIGQVVHVMREGMLGLPGGEYTLEATAENPAVLIQLYEQEEDGFWEATREYSACMMSLMIPIEPLPMEPELKDMETAMAGEMMYEKVDDSILPTQTYQGECCPEELEKQAPCWDGYVQRGMKPGENGKMVPNCVPAEKSDDLWEDDEDVTYETDSVKKAEGYSPPAGARSAARRAIKFKEDGKAKGAGTSVGWTRAGQLARGETLSLDTVKRMYSYFSRHEVDKKGKDWGNQANPSNGYIMWLAWGGDAGFSWSRRIVNAERDKSLFSDFGKKVSKTARLTEVFTDPKSN
jgi:hypothetical protein